MFHFIPDEIDFSKEETYNQMQNQLSLALQSILNSEKNTFEQLENLLFFTQSWMEPFICEILIFESLTPFSELKNGFEYVKKHWEMSAERPYPQLKVYCEMCNQIACIFDSHDYYYFMNYFATIGDKSHIIDRCMAQIENILFNILWWLDSDLGNNAKNSYFLKIVHELSSHLSGS